MDLKADDVLSFIAEDTPVIDIHRPSFNLWTSVQVAIVCTSVCTNRLVTKCHLECTVMVTAKDKFCTHVWLVLASLLEAVPAQLLQSLCQTHLQGFLLIAEWVNLPVWANLKVKTLPSFVIVIGWILVLLVKPLLVPTTFILVCVCRAEGLRCIHVHGLFDICSHNVSDVL